MSERSDDPRDEVATIETQRSDQDVRRDERKRSGRQPAEVRTTDDDLGEPDDEREERLSESRPTPGSAEGERDTQTQSASNVPRRDDER